MTEFSDDDRLYLDDLHIGQRFTSGTHVVDEEQIKAFARQFDPQPLHLDNEAAKDTLFSGLVAHCCDHHAPYSRGLLAVRRRYHRSWR
jgi:acyl dehydratase